MTHLFVLGIIPSVIFGNLLWRDYIFGVTGELLEIQKAPWTESSAAAAHITLGLQH